MMKNAELPTLRHSDRRCGELVEEITIGKVVILPYRSVTNLIATALDDLRIRIAD